MAAVVTRWGAEPNRKAAKAAYDRAWRAANRERLIAQHKAWRASNQDYVKAKKREYYLANREEIRAKAKAKRAAGGDKQSPESKARKEEQRLRRRTGFTSQLIAEALARQGWLCAICGVDMKPMRRRDWHADHCHSSGLPRGILCGPCNMALGLFKDDPARLRQALAYLENPPLGLA